MSWWDHFCSVLQDCLCPSSESSPWLLPKSWLLPRLCLLSWCFSGVYLSIPLPDQGLHCPKSLKAELDLYIGQELCCWEQLEWLAWQFCLEFLGAVNRHKDGFFEALMFQGEWIPWSSFLRVFILISCFLTKWSLEYVLSLPHLSICPTASQWKITSG